MIENRVRETSTSTGTGTFSLDGAIDATHNSFVELHGDGNPCYYVIFNMEVAGECEMGLGVCNAGIPDTLVRSTVYESTNSNNHVNFSAGTKIVFTPLPKQFFAVTPGPNLVPRADATGKIDGDWVDGGVTGPGSGTDNHAAVFDGATGQLLRESPSVVFHPVDGDASDKLETAATFKSWETAADGATVTFDFDLSDQWVVTFAGNRTLDFDNASVGQTVRILRYQDATGNRTPTWWPNIAWDNDLAPDEDPSPNGWSMVDLVCTSLDGYGVPNWKEVCRSTSAPRQEIVTVTEASPSIVDYRISPQRSLTLTANRNVEFTPSSGNPIVALSIIYDGAYSPTFTDTIKWPADVEPTYTSTADRRDEFCFRHLGSDVWQCLGMQLDLEA